MRRRHALLAASAATLPTWAQQTKTIRLIVPYPPGGPLDIAARALADQVKDTLGTVIVDNRPAQRLNIGSVRELVAYLKRNPAKINYGSGGNGSAGHLAGELFKTQAGVFMVHIPYGGGPGAQVGLLSGQVDLNFDNLAAASANIRSGKLKALAVTTARRSSAMPEVPTVADAAPISAWRASTSTPGSACSARRSCRPR